MACTVVKLLAPEAIVEVTFGGTYCAPTSTNKVVRRDTIFAFNISEGLPGEFVFTRGSVATFNADVL
jgi:hypothetical protein